MKQDKVILYVEDDADDVFFLERAFSKAGVTNPLVVVRDGQSALEYLAGKGRFADREKHPMPCLILLDLNLPKKNGFEVLKWIRHQPGFFTIAVVILSASNQPKDVHEACALGANAYLVKPPSADQLVKLARSIRDFWLTHSQSPPDCLHLDGKDPQALPS